MSYQNRIFDVVIMGGGPAGATLGARLARETELSVAIFEASHFPRDHIGESFVHTIVPSLQESGALPKVLASECWIKKFGGYYAWDKHPWATYFEHQLFERDGALRWSIHCNRPEFDQILLDHAKSCGVEVFEGTPVTAVKREDGLTRISLGSDGEVQARVFVNSSGRTGNTTITGDKTFLSDYRNIAIWSHIVGGKPAQEAVGDWNIFHKDDMSPVGSFAFEDGWFWYIPVPKMVQGKRVRTHSLGMVTDPAVLKQQGKRYTEPARFMEVAKRVPFLGELLKDAQLISDRFSTATNYSRISDRMCDLDTAEIRIGDAAYFVDPLFSSGVHFALLHAGAATALIKQYFEHGADHANTRELWADYHGMLTSIAHGFSLGIDQWYHEIANSHPDSVYWNNRGDSATFAPREETFAGLVNGSIHGDLLQVITKGTNALGSLGKDGAMRRTYQLVEDKEPAADALLRLKPNVVLIESVTLEAPPVVDGKPVSFLHPGYWSDPVGMGDQVRPLFPGAVPCYRFVFGDGETNAQVRFFESEHNGLELHRRLSDDAPMPYAELKQSLSPPQQHLLLHLVLSDMLIPV